MRLSLPLLLSVVCLSSGVGSASDPAPWPQELADAKTLDLAWEDLAGKPVKKTVTGEPLKQVQRHFSRDATGAAYKCIFHRDASFTLPSGRRVDLCFGCGLARAGAGGDVPFDKATLRALYESLLGKQPPQKDLFPGY